MDNLVKAAGLEKAKPPFMNGRARKLPYHGIIYLLSGEGTFRDRDTSEQAVGPGTIFYLYPGLEHCYDPLPGTVWTEYWTLFDGEEAENRFGKLLSNNTLHHCGIIPELASAYEELYGYAWEQRPDTPELCSYGLHRILGLVFRHLNRREGKLLSSPIAAAIALMQRQLCRPSVELDAIARKHGISFETLRKQFRRQTGSAPHEYFLEMKLNAARNLLLSGRPIKETAGELGFADPYYFSRLFKRHCGLSPSLLTADRRKRALWTEMSKA